MRSLVLVPGMDRAEIYRQLTELSVDGGLDRNRMDRVYELYISEERMVRQCVLPMTPA